MDIKIKKIIAREGLVIVGFFIFSFIFIFILSNIPDFKAYKNSQTGELMRGIIWDDNKSKIQQIGIYISLLGYPLYLFVRFFIWAIRILKQK